MKFFFGQPNNISFPFEPGNLPFGKVPGIPFNSINSFIQRNFSGKIIQYLFLAQSLHGNHISGIALYF